MKTNYLKFPNWPLLFQQNPVMSANRVAWSALVITMLSGATSNAFAKQLESAFTPLMLLFVSESLMAFFQLFSFGFLPTIQRLRKIPRSAWLPIFTIGITNSVMAPLLWFQGLQSTTSVNATLLSKMEMVFTVVFAAILMNERWTVRQLLGALGILFGIVFISMRGFGEAFVFHNGDLLLLISCIFYAAGSMVYRLRLHTIPADIVILCRCMVGITAFFVIVPFLRPEIGKEIVHFPIALIPALLGYCFISQFVSLFTFYQAIDKLSMSTVSVFVSSSVIFATLFSHWYLGEPLLWYHGIGMLFILGGTIALEVAGLHTTHQQIIQRQSTVEMQYDQ